MHFLVLYNISQGKSVEKIGKYAKISEQSLKTDFASKSFSKISLRLFAQKLLYNNHKNSKKLQEHNVIDIRRKCYLEKIKKPMRLKRISNTICLYLVHLGIIIKKIKNCGAIQDGGYW
jgi:YesN/AraC family two-component response regulator